MSSDGAPIIRIVKKKNAAGHHGGAWKVAYADFVTAMMAFFLVMWIVGLSAPIRKAIASYFKDPSGFMKSSRGGSSPLSDSSSMAQTKPAPVMPQAGGPSTLAMMKEQMKKVQEAIMNQIKHAGDLQKLYDSVKIHMTDEGLRIELLEKTPALFFDTGSSKLKPATVHLLSIIASHLRVLKNPIIVEGYTDARPYLSSNGYSNWNLSCDRADAARVAMSAHGLRKGQVLSVRGYADQKLYDPKHPFSYVNRRVSILVAFSKKGI